MIFQEDGCMIIVATRPIYPGAEILGCYTQPRWGTHVRHKHLLTTKYFQCSCPRCMDLSECGTFCSALRCPTAACPGESWHNISVTAPSAVQSNKENWVFSLLPLWSSYHPVSHNFSSAKAALGMQMSVSLSVIQSVTLIFLSDLLVYFIIANRIIWNLGNEAIKWDQIWY